MQDVKHNIDSLTLMHVPVDFDELSIRVLNRLGPINSNISHALQVRETPVTFEELFEHLLNYEAQLQLSVFSTSLATTLATTLVTSAVPSYHYQLHYRGYRNHNRSQQSWALPDTKCETLEKKSNFSENGKIIKLPKWLREA